MDLLQNHYQNAYVTRNMDAALPAFRKLYGDAEIKVFTADTEIDTPQGRGRLQNKLAFIWCGGLQYELIEPMGGMVDIYRDGIVANQPFTFHHVAMRSHDWAKTRAEVAALNRPIVQEGGHDALKFLYVDARDLVGHYLEYVWMTPEMWTMVGGK